MLSYLEHSIKWRNSADNFVDKEAELSVLIDKFTKGKNGHLFSEKKTNEKKDSEDKDKKTNEETNDENKKTNEETNDEKNNEDEDKKTIDCNVKKINEETIDCEEKTNEENSDCCNVKKTNDEKTSEKTNDSNNVKKFEKMITETGQFPDVRKNPRFRLLYKKLLLKYHPDKQGGDETIFSNIRDDVENRYLLFFIKHSRDSFNEYYKQDLETWSFVIHSHVEKWKKIVYAMC